MTKAVVFIRESCLNHRLIFAGRRRQNHREQHQLAFKSTLQWIDEVYRALGLLVTRGTEVIRRDTSFSFAGSMITYYLDSWTIRLSVFGLVCCVQVMAWSFLHFSLRRPLGETHSNGKPAR